MGLKEPTKTDRGFAVFDPIEDGSSMEVQLRESSSAMDARVWLKISGPPTFDAPGGAEVAAHLDLEAATLLRDQLTWAITNHYHHGGA